MAADVELVVETLHVSMHRAARDAQLVRDLLLRVTVEFALDDLKLPA